MKLIVFVFNIDSFEEKITEYSWTSMQDMHVLFNI